MIQSNMRELLGDANNNDNKIRSFFKMMLDNDCIEDDCDEISSPCCSTKMQIVFGTLPLEVMCNSCNNRFMLRDLVKNLKKGKEEKS